MPFLNGIETAEKIRETDKKTPIIAISGYLNDNYYKGFFEQGFCEAISKPFSVEVLRAKVQNALNNALIPSYQKLIDLFTLTVAHMGDARDALTQNHNLRIGELSSLLAAEMGFNNRHCEDIRLGARLHDIGKIAINDKILQKPGKLTDDEFDYIKVHTSNGAVILDGLAKESQFSYLKLASEIAMYHHEKLDGKGYPNQLKGNEIPLYVRIVTVVDIYDAVTMQRPYHDERPHEEGIKVLLELQNQGKLDPDIIAIFLKRETEIKEIKNLFG